MDRSGTDPIDWNMELQRHQHWLLKVLRCRINNVHTVEDLYQNIALAVVKQAAKPTDPEKVAPWLYRLAVRQTINHYRKSHRRMHTQEQPNCESGSETPLEWIMAEEKRSEVRKALQNLKPQDREMLVLKYTENWSYTDLANHLGVKIKTVEYRLLKARKRLRTLLTKTIVHTTLSPTQSSQSKISGEAIRSVH